jgi:hypothetical protein
MKKDELLFTIKNDKLSELLNIFKDLRKIEKMAKFKIIGDKVITYSIEKSGNTTLAMNSFVFLVSDFFESLKFKSDKFEDIDDGEFEDVNEEKKEDIIKINWTILNLDFLIKKLSFYENSNGKIKAKFSLVKLPDYDEWLVKMVYMNNSVFKFSLNTAEDSSVKNISLDQFNAIKDINSSISEFKIPASKFMEAKKAAGIDSEEENITIHLKNDNVYFAQSSWELLCNKTEKCPENKIITFPKKMLRCMTPIEDEMNFKLYETYILYSEINKNLIVGYEQSY